MLKRRWWPVGLALLCPCLSSRPALAASAEALALRWHAPAGCPSEREVRAEIERLLGHPVPENESSTLLAEADVEAAEGAFRVRLRTSTDRDAGEKRLEAPSCRSLADAVALVVALAYDPQALAEGATPPGPKSPPAPDGGRAKEGRRPDDGPPLRPSVDLSVAALVGALPALAPGFAVGAGLASERLRFEATASIWGGQRAQLSPRPPAATPGGEFELWAAGGRACYGPERRSGWLVEFCAAAELGRMSGRGVGVTRVEKAAFLWGAVGAGLTAHWAWSPRMGLRASVEGLAPLARPTFYLEPFGEVHRPSSVAGRASLGVEANF
jgi:hypothetical protein